MDHVWKNCTVEEISPHLTTTSFQVVVESDEIPSEGTGTEHSNRGLASPVPSTVDDHCRRPARTLGLSLPHAYATRINGAEVFFHLEPPPPYEDVQSSNTSEQGGALKVNVMNCVDSAEVSEGQDSQGDGTCPGGHAIESPCVTFQLASWRAVRI
ncbi:protein FAM189A2 [Chiroxiphia lanceolata]|uniref:protein FAM189A2 n=1 Tax=Chiroxiphia lanceolata TaxID=296741 RepID=UPI0013CF00B7|nr:protein FAM189A2 [Chiroxiphia lanceolata]